VHINKLRQRKTAAQQATASALTFDLSGPPKAGPLEGMVSPLVQVRAKALALKATNDVRCSWRGHTEAATEFGSCPHRCSPSGSAPSVQVFGR
jgi:hypothetical protein